MSLLQRFRSMQGEVDLCLSSMGSEAMAKPSVFSMYVCMYIYIYIH